MAKDEPVGVQQSQIYEASERLMTTIHDQDAFETLFKNEHEMQAVVAENALSNLDGQPSHEQKTQIDGVFERPSTADDQVDLLKMKMDYILERSRSFDDSASGKQTEVWKPSYDDAASEEQTQMDSTFERAWRFDDSASGQEMRVHKPSFDDSIIEQRVHKPSFDDSSIEQQSCPKHGQSIGDNFERPRIADIDEDGVKQELFMVDDEAADAIERLTETLDVQDPFKSLQTINDQDCEQVVVEDQASYDELHMKDIDDQTSEQKRQLPNPSFCDDQATTSQKTQLNILLLGETGVGKSTMINAFANYITFQSMEDAASSNQDMIALVPMAFTHVDQNYQDYEIKFGEPDPNEQHKSSGESVTQSCRSYTFPLSENQTVHLIDTPGIGDTRGVEQDRANFSQVLAYLANYNEIHGICIMLKPNNSRLNITFSFCIKELLRNLHKSASANIVFLFTYARGSLYTPGDTVIPLKALLKQVLDVPPNVAIPFNENTVYCVDNEAVRLVVASKKGFSFSEKDRASFSESWSRSTEECKRMLMHFKSIEPHKVLETVSLNTAASLVMKLQQPLASVISTIHGNLELCEMKKKELKEFEGNLADLQYKIKMEEVELQATELEGGAATVCTNVSCCETVLSESGQMETRYKVICKPASNAIPSWFSNTIRFFGKCKVCHCSLSQHIRITYVPQFVYRKAGLPSAIAEKVDAGSLLEARKLQYTEVEQRSREWQEELNAISKAAACFTVFLKSNTIATYSKDMQAYVKHQINMEKANGTARVALVKQLQAFLERYEQDTKEAGKEISAGDVMKIAKSLYEQRHTGAKLQELVEKVTTIEQRTAHLFVKSCPPPPRFNWLVQLFR